MPVIKDIKYIVLPVKLYNNNNKINVSQYSPAFPFYCSLNNMFSTF